MNADCCRAFAAMGDDESLLAACEEGIDEETIMVKEVYETQKEQCDAVTLTRMIHYDDSSHDDPERVGAITYEATDVLSTGLRCCINPMDWIENINACVDCTEEPEEKVEYTVDDMGVCSKNVCLKTDKCAEMNGRTVFVQEGECDNEGAGTTTEVDNVECCQEAEMNCD